MHCTLLQISKPMMEFVKGHFMRNAWHYGAIVFFFVLSAALFSKAYDGYVVRQGDITNFLGMSKEAYDAEVLLGERPDWTNAMFGGMPTTQISPKSPPFDIVKRARGLLSGLTGYSGITVFLLAMLGGYLLALALGSAPWIALLCGVGIGLSTFELLYFSAGHNSKVHAVAYMPFIIAGVMWAYRRNVFHGAAIAALGTAFHISSGHPQMTYYLLFLLAAIGIGETWRLGITEGNWRKAIRTSGIVLIAGIVGVIPRYSHLSDTKAYAENTIRGERILSESGVAAEAGGTAGLDRDYILEYSMADGEWWSIMCPDIKGGNSPLYWGEQKFSGGAFYFGAILVALFFMFLVAGRDSLKWPLLIVTALAVLLSRRDAGFLTDFFIDHVPLFNKFRDTKMMLVVVLMATSMGAGLGLKGLIADAQAREIDAKRRKLWMGAIGFLVVLFGGFYLFPELFFEFQSSVRQDVAVEQLGYQEALNRRLEIFRPDVLRTLGLLLVLAGCVAGILWNKIRPMPAILVLVVVSTMDLWNVDHRYFNDEKVNGAYRNWVKKVDYSFPFSPMPQMDRLLALDFNRTPVNEENAQKLYASYIERLKDVRLTRAEQDRLRTISQYGAMRFASPYRVMRWESPFNDSSVSYFFQSVGGYHAAKLRRYQDFVERVLTPERERLVRGIQSGQSESAFAGLTGLQMLNTRYIFFGQSPEPIAIPNVPGFGWVASSVSLAENDDDEMNQTAALTRPTDAVVHQEFESLLGMDIKNASGSVELTHYEPDFLEYDVAMDAVGLVVFSEIWYPEGWTAKIDGELVETMRANYVLRALNVPAGAHTVTFEFDQPASMIFEAIANLLLALFVAGAVWWGLKEKNAAIERA